MSIRDVQAGEVLTKQGTASREFFVMVGGTAVVKRSDREIARVGPAHSSERWRCWMVANEPRRS
jgi:5-deoxy-D-glucuronate isomerase